MKQDKKIIPLSIESIGSKALVKYLSLIFLIVLLICRNTQDMADRMFWTDEVYNFQTVTQSLREIPKWTVKGYHMQPPLFYWFGHFAARIGNDPMTLRSISLFFYFIIIGFVLFALHEVQLATRIFLCFVLIMSPFAAFAATEFKPYSLAALGIIMSSIFLYRAVKKPDRWLPAISYGLSALVLQYSLTLNCFAFGLQMLFLAANIFIYHLKSGFKATLFRYKPIIIVSLFLCIEYTLFLNIVMQTGQLLFPTSSFNYNRPNYFQALLQNIRILKEDIILNRHWTASFAPVFFLLGCTTGWLNRTGITAYLMSLFVGQLLFSTFMTFSRIDWAAQRYFVASYVAFILLCALGAEYFFERVNRKTAVYCIVCLLGITLPGCIIEFGRSIREHGFNPIVQAVEKMRCNQHPTVVLCDPLHDAIVPGYAYRNDPLIIVPYSDLRSSLYKSDVAQSIAEYATERCCFILLERIHHKGYSGTIKEILYALPEYSQEKVSIIPGMNIPDSAMLFTPVNFRMSRYNGKLK